MDKNAQRFRTGRLLTARDNSMICVLPFFCHKICTSKSLSNFWGAYHLPCAAFRIFSYRAAPAASCRFAGGGARRAAAPSARLRRGGMFCRGMPCRARFFAAERPARVCAACGGGAASPRFGRFSAPAPSPRRRGSRNRSTRSFRGNSCRRGSR